MIEIWKRFGNLGEKIGNLRKFGNLEIAWKFENNLEILEKYCELGGKIKFGNLEKNWKKIGNLGGKNLD